MLYPVPLNVVSRFPCEVNRPTIVVLIVKLRAGPVPPKAIFPSASKVIDLRYPPSVVTLAIPSPLNEVSSEPVGDTATTTGLPPLVPPTSRVPSSRRIKS